jgi:hypothetical protein
MREHRAFSEGDVLDVYPLLTPTALLTIDAMSQQAYVNLESDPPDGRARSFAVLCTGRKPYLQQDAP